MVLAKASVWISVILSHQREYLSGEQENITSGSSQASLGRTLHTVQNWYKHLDKGINEQLLLSLELLSRSMLCTP